MGNSNACTPSASTIDSIYSVAQDNGIIPDMTLDGTLSNFLSLNSSDALTMQYASIQRRLSGHQLEELDQGLTAALGTQSRVPYGGVGVVALALSLLLEALVNKIELGASGGKTSDPFERMFGAGNSTVSITVAKYLSELPDVAGDMEAMAEMTEFYDQRLKYELIRRYERMTREQRLSSGAIKQWLNGAAVHLHMRIHGARLASVPAGSAESLRLSYVTGFPSLLDLYAGYLRQHVRESPPGAKAGVLILAPAKRVQHWVAHDRCQSSSIASAMVIRILAAQNIQQSRQFFEVTGRNLGRLVQQRNSFDLQRENLKTLT